MWRTPLPLEKQFKQNTKNSTRPGPELVHVYMSLRPQQQLSDRWTSGKSVWNPLPGMHVPRMPSLPLFLSKLASMYHSSPEGPSANSPSRTRHCSLSFPTHALTPQGEGNFTQRPVQETIRGVGWGQRPETGEKQGRL